MSDKKLEIIVQLNTLPALCTDALHYLRLEMNDKFRAKTKEIETLAKRIKELSDE